MELILSSCVFNAFFISFSCVCRSLSAFRMHFWSLQWHLLCLVGVCLPLGWGFVWRVPLYLLLVGLSGLHLFLVLLCLRTLARGRTYGLFGRFFRFLLFLLWWFFHWAFYVARRVLSILCMMQDARSFCNLRSRFFLCLLRLLFLSCTRLVRAAQCILHSSSLDYSFVLCGLFAGICSIEWCSFLFFPRYFEVV